MIDTKGRHQSTTHIAAFFAYDHLPKGPLQDTARQCHDLAAAMVASLPDSPELSAGLRKLLESKDCFVRAAL